MELYGNGESTVVVFVYLLVNLLLRVYGSGRYGEKLRELGESSDGLGQSGGGLSGSGKFAVRINKIVEPPNLLQVHNTQKCFL